MRTEDLVVVENRGNEPLTLYALEMVGEGKDCLANSLSNDGFGNDDGLFVARAGDADGGRLLLLAGWRIATMSRRRGGWRCSLAGATSSRHRGGAVLACWHDDKLAAGRTTVLAHCLLWRDDESVARRMAVLASWLDDKLAAGRTMVLARWRDDESAAGRMTVLACWRNDSVLVRWRDDESAAGGPHRPQRR